MTLWLSCAVTVCAVTLATATLLFSPASAGVGLWVGLGGQALFATLLVGALFVQRSKATRSAALLDTATAAAAKARHALDEIVAETAAKSAVSKDAIAQIAAFSQHQAAIEFLPDGTVISANHNFCALMGYDASTIAGTRHAAFCDPTFAGSSDYSAFWHKLRSGAFVAGEVKRITKSGATVWLLATYNPIPDATGAITKVVKFATDITPRKQAFEQIDLALRALSEGDLSARIPSSVPEDFVGLRDSFNATLTHLQTMVGDIKALSDEMKGATQKIAVDAEDISKRTDGQAAAVQQTSAAVEEIAVTVRNNASNAETVEAAASKMAVNADVGAAVAQQAIEAMGRIEESSDRVEEIITVIESIAFQTNLLALNASIESARAGDAGRGFAVVANEVRSLAQRSAVAAKDISDLIRAGKEEITTGASLVRQSGGAFADINSQAAHVVASVMNISRASVEQAGGVAEISTAIAHIDGAIQENATLCEKTATVANGLVGRTGELAQLVAFFRGTGKDEPMVPARTPVRQALVAVAGGRAQAAAAGAPQNWSDF